MQRWPRKRPSMHKRKADEVNEKPGMQGPQMGPQGSGPQGPQVKPAPAPEQAPEGDGGSNPVVEAFQTIATFIAAQGEKGNPQAAAMQDWLKKGLQLFAGKGEGQGPEAPPMEKPQPEGPQEMSRDVNAGPGSARVL